MRLSDGEGKTWGGEKCEFLDVGEAIRLVVSDKYKLIEREHTPTYTCTSMRPLQLRKLVSSSLVNKQPSILTTPNFLSPLRCPDDMFGLHPTTDSSSPYLTEENERARLVAHQVQTPQQLDFHPGIESILIVTDGSEGLTLFVCLV